MKRLILSLLVMLCFSEVHAKAMNGKMALAFCNNNVNCALIASSYSDGFSYALSAIRAENTVFCMPSEATTGQLGRVFKQFLLDNPEKLHFTAASLAVTAFSEEFPCSE